jgi:hypothetical protein
MGKINWSRVLLGGLLAGLAINVVETVSGMVYMDDMKASLEAHGLSMNESAAMMIFWVVYGFVWGIAAIWLYASVRPRYGAGPKTAVITGVGFWFIGYFLPMIGWSSIGLYPASMLTTWTLLGLVEMIVATLLGAWIYKEGEAAAA